jgi:hypothetical protein
MAVRNELTIGANPDLNNLIMYRKVDDTPFLPVFSFDGDELSLASKIDVRYLEYYKNANGDIVNELTKPKYYVVANIPATYKTIAVEDRQEQVIDTPAWDAANNWFLQLARTPITAPYGIMDSIEATLQQFPLDIPNGYVLQKPL